jgi:hypothetical protein
MYIYIKMKLSLALLLHISEVLGSDINPETGSPDRIFMAFLSHPGRCQNSAVN